jgi:hypothetical protein
MLRPFRPAMKWDSKPSVMPGFPLICRRVIPLASTAARSCELKFLLRDIKACPTRSFDQQSRSLPATSRTDRVRSGISPTPAPCLRLGHAAGIKDRNATGKGGEVEAAAQREGMGRRDEAAGGSSLASAPASQQCGNPAAQAVRSRSCAGNPRARADGRDGNLRGEQPGGRPADQGRGRKLRRARSTGEPSHESSHRVSIWNAR